MKSSKTGLKMGTRAAVAAIVFAVALLAFGGCASYPDYKELSGYDPGYGYRFENLNRGENSDSLFVVLCFSGGGTRAAAMSYEVLDRLANTPIIWKGQSKRLLDEVDIISSVSGGSFTAAYFGLFGDEIFTTFKNRFLRVNVEQKLLARLLNPVNLLRLASSKYSRIDLAAEYYHQEIFRKKKFSDLTASGKRPYLIINATNMSTGDRFEFTQPQFNIICSDLNNVSVGRAVAASSAYPGLLTSLTVDNFGFGCGFSPPRWTRGALRDRDITSTQFPLAITYQTYGNLDEHRWLHLLDGGVSDNIGLVGAMEMLFSIRDDRSLLGRISLGRIEKLVFIVVNAGTDKPTQWDRTPNNPGIVDVLTAAATNPIDRLSFNAMKALNDMVHELQSFYRKQAACDSSQPDCVRVDFYPIFLGFQGIKDTDNADGIREKLLSLPTNFHLADDQLELLKKGAKILIDTNLEYQKLTRALR